MCLYCSAFSALSIVGIPSCTLHPSVSILAIWRSAVEFAFLESIVSISAGDWNALYGKNDSPLLEYHWLRSFEESGSMCPETGWQPFHLLGFAHSEDAAAMKNPVLILPLHLKSHSWGEFVFDFAWSDVASRLRKKYYPKAVGVIPATPVTGYQALGSPSDAELAQAMEYAEARLKSMGVHSLSFLFTEDRFADQLEKCGFVRWVHQGFAWKRRGMSNFDDYLSLFRKNQRRNIRKERRGLEERGLVVDFICGSSLNAELARDMYQLYEKTTDQFGPWGAKFLTEDFFHYSFEHCGDSLLLVSARGKDGSGSQFAGRVPGRSMLVHGGGRLYGRYWGAREFVKDLHFNLCYYYPIEFALNRGLDTFDPGMGGEHKVRRGFGGIQQFSMHRFFDPQMDNIFKANIHQFNTQAQRQIEFINEVAPQKSMPAG